MDEWLHTLPSAATDPDVQEALSRRYGNDMIMLLPLKSGKVAVFNSARELCAIIDDDRSGLGEYDTTWDTALNVVKQPTTTAKPTIDLEELGLL